LRERLTVLGKVRGRLAVMMLIMMMQGMSGHVAVNAYLQQILSDGGLSHSAGPFAIGVDALRVVATIVAGLTVERFGRKKLFVGGGFVQVRNEINCRANDEGVGIFEQVCRHIMDIGHLSNCCNSVNIHSAIPREMF